MKNSTMLMLAAILAAHPLCAEQDFSGQWEFNPSKSQNIGMMAQMKLLTTVKQTKREVIITDFSTFNGKEQTNETRFDLTGKPVPNKNPMEATAETVTKWDGDKLVTTWTSPGSIAGTNSIRTETRSLSPDRRSMTVESSRGKGPAMVMVYDRK
jgi:hypothetical protein